MDGCRASKSNNRFCTVGKISVPSSKVTNMPTWWTRYLYTHVLLLRPLLLLATKFPSKFISPSSAEGFETLDTGLVKRFCTLCVTTAFRLVDAIHQNLDTSYTSSGWHSVYCTSSTLDRSYASHSLTSSIVTFASAIVLLAAQICPAVDAETVRCSFDVSWNRCLFILEHYKDEIQAAERAIPALKELRSRMNLEGRQGKTHPPGSILLCVLGPDRQTVS